MNIPGYKFKSLQLMLEYTNYFKTITRVKDIFTTQSFDQQDKNTKLRFHCLGHLRTLIAYVRNPASRAVYDVDIITPRLSAESHRTVTDTVL